MNSVVSTYCSELQQTEVVIAAAVKKKQHFQKIHSDLTVLDNLFCQIQHDFNRYEQNIADINTFEANKVQFEQTTKKYNALSDFLVKIEYPENRADRSSWMVSMQSTIRELAVTIQDLFCHLKEKSQKPIRKNPKLYTTINDDIEDSEALHKRRIKLFNTVVKNQKKNSSKQSSYSKLTDKKPTSLKRIKNHASLSLPLLPRFSELPLEEYERRGSAPTLETSTTTTI